MAWQIQQLPPVTTNQVVDADLLIINNLGVTRSITMGQMKVVLQGTAFVLDNASPNDVIPVFKALASAASGAAGYTNIDVAIQPKGTGSFALQVADNTAVGGQKRGASAVDLQMARGNAAQVAGGIRSNIGGGFSNTIVAAAAGTIAGGSTNAINGGNWHAIGGGQSNTVASGGNQVIAGGSNNTTTGGSNNTIGGGDSNTTTNASYGTIGGGQSNLVDSTGGTISGGISATTRGVNSMWSYSGSIFSVKGDAQFSSLPMKIATTNATVTKMTSDSTSFASNTNQYTLPNNSAFLIFGQVVARSNPAADAAAFQFNVLIKRGASAAATAIVGSPTVTTLFNDAGAAAWAVTLTADTTNGSLTVSVTGAAATNIKWSARFQAVEVVG